ERYFACVLIVTENFSQLFQHGFKVLMIPRGHIRGGQQAASHALKIKALTVIESSQLEFPWRKERFHVLVNPFVPNLLVVRAELQEHLLVSAQKRSRINPSLVPDQH